MITSQTVNDDLSAGSTIRKVIEGLTLLSLPVKSNIGCPIKNVTGGLHYFFVNFTRGIQWLRD